MAFQFKIQLKNISNPTVWRRLLLSEQFSFMRLHYVIQAAFGWENYHLFQFSPKGYSSSSTIGIPYEEENFGFGNEKTLDADKVKLSDIFSVLKQKYTYIYDFGDDWIHTITLEKITEEKVLRASLLAGKGVCPPEDCGGPWGYANLLNVLQDTSHPEHFEMKEWMGLDVREQWDVNNFDFERTKKLVAKV
jgi:hypothetical protein